MILLLEIGCVVTVARAMYDHMYVGASWKMKISVYLHLLMFRN